ncbi:MAG: glycoside hydrolase family 28 protein [Clostridium sp.]|jgi:hypothetical protein|nr:glycoside hydrolase family 28 protein [Clostridium sp.]
MIYNVLHYGATGDGTTNDAPAIQAAIDHCAASGGGRVLLPGGATYRSGSLILRSFVELHLEAGAVLKGSDRLEDYDLFGSDRPAATELSAPTYQNCEYSGMPTLFFLYAKDSESVSVTGLGRIDGNEKIFYGAVTPWHIEGAFYPRVPLLFLENITHLTLLHVTLTGSAFWTTHMVGCNDVLIDGIRILNNLRLANCDGIDPDHCRNVRITNCHIETADDCIVFKNTAAALRYGSCENILVSGCTLISTSAAIKFGTESEAPFRNITVTNCCISRSNRGISLMLRDKGLIENVTFSNLNIDTRLFSTLHWWGEAEPIAITAVRRSADAPVGTISGIRFRNINCISEKGILLYGDESHNITDVTFDSVSIRLEKKTDWPRKFHDLRPCAMDCDMLPGAVNAVFARHADQVRMEGIKVSIAPQLLEQMGQVFDVAECEGFTMTQRY